MNDTVQAWASVGSAILSAVTIWVLVITKGAADRQAKAAEKQAEAATAQTIAAREATTMAREANSLLLRQITSQATPILVLARDQARSGETADRAAYLIENQGPGAATDVRWYYSEPLLSPAYEPISSTLIGAASSAKIKVNEEKLSIPGLTISYQALDGRFFKTDVMSVNGVLTQQYAGG